MFIGSVDIEGIYRETVLADLVVTEGISKQSVIISEWLWPGQQRVQRNLTKRSMKVVCNETVSIPPLSGTLIRCKLYSQHTVSYDLRTKWSQLNSLLKS